MIKKSFLQGDVVTGRLRLKPNTRNIRDLDIEIDVDFKVYLNIEIDVDFKVYLYIEIDVDFKVYLNIEIDVDF